MLVGNYSGVKVSQELWIAVADCRLMLSHAHLSIIDFAAWDLWSHNRDSVVYNHWTGLVDWTGGLSFFFFSSSSF